MRTARTLVALAVAAAAALHGGAAALEGDVELLEPDAAFAFSADAGGGQIAIRYDIADGYYMYRERFVFAVDGKETPAEAVGFPAGEIHADPFFGDMEIYRDQVEMTVPVAKDDDGPVVLRAVSQGCNEVVGVCYPPATHEVTLAYAAASGGGGGPGPAEWGSSGFLDDPENFVDRVLGEGNLAWVVAAFFVFGVLLSFTPCVLPVIPLLSGIIAQGGGGKGRTAVLTAAYVGGLSTTYTLLGVVAGLGGSLFALQLQHPIALTVYGLAFMLLAASLFDLVRIPMPMLRGGGKRGNERRISVLGAATMGMFSTFITSACAAPPLAGALLYIAKTGDAVLGGSALFAMGIGMSVLLVVAGFSAGALVPRLGAHTMLAKHMLGYLMLVMAAWIVSPLMSVPGHMAVQGIILAVAGLHLCWTMWTLAGKSVRPGMAAAGIPAVLGAVLLVGGATGGKDLFDPLSHLWEEDGAHAATHTLVFRETDDEAGLAQVLGGIEQSRAMLYFTAEWCVACDELERLTFSDGRVADRLGEFALVKINVTEMDPPHATLLRRYDLIGPPGLVFVDREGGPLLRLIGYKPPKRFLAALDRTGI